MASAATRRGPATDDDSNVFDFLAPSGRTCQAMFAFGENFPPGRDCFANALIVRS
jgi:hypothetical protein